MTDVCSPERRAGPADVRRPLGGTLLQVGEEMVDVVQFQRRAGRTSFSVERLFDDVRAAMPPDIDVSLRVNRHMSRGVWPRVVDAFEAWRHRGTVNHVLGDVHYLAWLLPRGGTLLTILDCVTLDRLSGLRRWLFWLVWYWWPTRRAARITVISEFSKSALLRWVRYPDDRIHVIPPPLSAEFAPAPLPPEEGLPRLLQVGTVENKNLDRVIEALSGLAVVLVIVGVLTPAQCSRMDVLGVRYECHVDLTRDQLVEQYRRANIIVFVSTYEGFGLPIIEAQAIGRPVVTGNVTAMPEAAGEGACLVDPFDVADIRRGILRVLDDPTYAADLVERGFRNTARYAPERIAGEYAAIYREMSESQGRNQ